MVDRRVAQPAGLQLSSLAQPHISESVEPMRGDTLPVESGEHESARPAILFDDQSTVTANPFFDFSGKPISHLNVAFDLVFGKLRDNIALGFPSATDDQILEAARLAGVEQFAAAHPFGYDMPIAEGGRSLSGGQKQAVGLARAMIRKPQILFLDEPTAHFDLRSEAEFLERLKVLARGDVLTQQELRFFDSLKLFERQVELTHKLYIEKIVPEIEMLQMDQKVTEMKGQIAEAQSRIANIKAAFRSQSEEDLAKSRGDLAVLDQTIKSAQDRVRRAELRSPVNGIVNKLNVNTVGAVIQPGGNMMDIVPLDDTLLVEGRIRPQDIAFIRPQQDAVVKLSAYDSSVFGSLEGKVERISADTIADERPERGEKGETFYRVMIRTDKNHLGTSANPLPILPGMLATVEVLTGKKTVLDYLLKPARVLREEALRER
jgi:multidrug efflux pump subunit AcrA (membrane-fusion protein)